MIEIKAKTVEENERKGVDVKAKIIGPGDDIMTETLAIISSLMREIKSTDKILHLQCLLTLVEHPGILRGEDEDSEEMGDRMVMSLGKMTDKCVIN